MRNAGRLVLGFYPLPEIEARRIRNYLRFPECGFSAVDPCLGDGVVFDALTTGTQAHRYGIELDTWRAQEAAEKTIDVVHGDALEVHCPPESLSLLYLNPPYDFEVGAYGNRRFEELFLRHGALRPGQYIEIRYLYGTPEKHLVQPCFLNIREDVCEADCAWAQMRIGSKWHPET